MARARTQAGNLAHALKTPLSVLANHARGLDDEGSRLVLEEVGRMRRQVDWQLARARAAAARAVPGRRTEVRPRLEALARAVAMARPDRVPGFEILAPPGLTAPCEAQDFDEVAGNLLDNAAKWARGRIRASAQARPGEFELVVEDDGPGPSAEAREAAFRRGERMDEATPGSGLGLAIVRDLVDLYGGTVALGDAPGGGLRATVTLPEGARQPVP